MITRADLRRALEQALTHPTNPAILRLPEAERTVEGLARAYLPRTIWRAWGSDESEDYPALHDVHNAGSDRMGEEWASRRTLDLSDPGTAHAVLVVLALTRGYDPGVAGLGVMWERADECWMLTTASQSVAFEPADEDHGIAEGDSTIACLSWLCAPTVAAELDYIKAIAAALLHVCPRETT